MHTQIQIHTLPHNRRKLYYQNPRTPPHFRAYVSTVLPIGFPRASIPTATRHKSKAAVELIRIRVCTFSARLQVSPPSLPQHARVTIPIEKERASIIIKRFGRVSRMYLQLKFTKSARRTHRVGVLLKGVRESLLMCSRVCSINSCVCVIRCFLSLSSPRNADQSDRRERWKLEHTHYAIAIQTGYSP